MISRIMRRFFHLQKPSMTAEKSLLATLRKKTGYTFANCKKALEMHNNDLQQAENWLKEQAQTLGWAKATKLEGRPTSQGLIGVSVKDRNAALVEVNCETDFVARNKEFHKIVEESTLSCLNHAEKQPGGRSRLTKMYLDAEQLKNLQARDGKTLADHLAMMIGNVGENASLKRAFCLKAQEGIHLSGYAHPSGSDGSVLLGKIGGLVALKSENEADLDIIGKQLCQHIVGMNPKKIGSASDKPAKNKDEEICLIHQEFLLDEDVTIGELLEENQVKVLDFKRFECGVSDVEEDVRPLELLETCQ